MNASLHYQLRHCAVYRPPTHSHAPRSIIQWCLHFAWLEFNSFPAICTWPVQTNKLQRVFSHHCSLLPFSTWLLSDDLQEVWVISELFVPPLTILSRRSDHSCQPVYSNKDKVNFLLLLTTGPVTFTKEILTATFSDCWLWYYVGGHFSSVAC